MSQFIRYHYRDDEGANFYYDEHAKVLRAIEKWGGLDMGRVLVDGKLWIQKGPEAAVTPITD